MMFEEAEYEIARQNNAYVDYKETVKQLPYIFKDPVEFDKKIDPRKLQFGSKIDNDGPKNKYHLVKEIISPEKLVLDNGLNIRLLGVRKKKETISQAINFIKSKTHGQRVFMKFDEKKYDKDNHLLCYLYLSNKTFLNAHLIKKGFALADNSSDYKYKTKFLSLEKSNESRTDANMELSKQACSMP